MKQPTNEILFDYWNEVRGARLAPTRFEIEPSRLARVLSETFILERASDGTFPFRLAGTRICEQFGRELRGENFLDLFGQDWRRIAQALDTAREAGAVLVASIQAETADGRAVAFEAVVLPLMHPEHEVTRYLGGLSATDLPAWLGVEPLAATWLGSHELVWPDGRTFQMSDDDERQQPLVPELAAARIVRSARRQFRILDGGRKA